MLSEIFNFTFVEEFWLDIYINRFDFIFNASLEVKQSVLCCDGALYSRP